jgi:hypothetical protein
MDQEFEQPEDMETIVSGPDEGEPEEDFSTLDDDLDSLREKSTRTSDVYDDLEEGEGSGLSGAVRGFSPSQRLILAVLLFVDVLACACAILFIFDFI